MRSPDDTLIRFMTAARQLAAWLVPVLVDEARVDRCRKLLSSWRKNRQRARRRRWLERRLQHLRAKNRRRHFVN